MVGVLFARVAIPSFLVGFCADEGQGLTAVWASGA